MIQKIKRKMREKEIPENKLKSVDGIAELIKKNKTFMIASIKGLPGKQFQIIKNKLKEHAKIKVLKKNIVIRAIEKANIGSLIPMKQHVKEDSALFFSDLNPFELSSILSDYKTPATAKKGQIAPEDIIIEPGPTDLVPGPVISELGALGLKIAIEEGKINIKEKKVIVKQGEIINEAASGLMSKLDIKPFRVGFEPIAAYDSVEEKVYTNIKIDKEKTLEELKHAFSKTLAFAVSLAYPCKETIKFLLGKAARQEKALSSLIKPEEQK